MSEILAVQVERREGMLHEITGQDKTVDLFRLCPTFPGCLSVPAFRDMPPILYPAHRISLASLAA